MNLRTLLLVTILCGIGVTLLSCSPGYVMRAAYQEGKILAGRRDITEVIADPATTPLERTQLGYVTQAREFALRMGLTPKNSFTKYTKIDSEVLTWVVVGCRADSFTLRAWWFPFVGTLPYKGFFEKEDAIAAAKELEADGYETWVRGSDAFSTLGWFNDPILTPALKQPAVNLVNTVIHESVHATVWIPNNVAFNESLANFVGITGAQRFFEDSAAQCATPRTDCDKLRELAALAQRIKSRELAVGRGVQRLYQRLTDLYASSRSKEEKLQERGAVFREEMTTLRAQYPELKILQEVNNAEIVQLILYLTDLPRFEREFELCGGTWDCFLSRMRTIQQKVASASAPIDPFTELAAAP